MNNGCRQCRNCDIIGIYDTKRCYSALIWCRAANQLFTGWSIFYQPQPDLFMVPTNCNVNFKTNTNHHSTMYHHRCHSKRLPVKHTILKSILFKACDSVFYHINVDYAKLISWFSGLFSYEQMRESGVRFLPFYLQWSPQN